MSNSDIDYKKLINAMKHPVFVIQDGKIVLVNSTVCQISEYSEDELLGSEFSILIAKEKRAGALEYYKKRVAGEDCASVYESLAVTKTGKTIPVDVEVIPVQYENKPAFQVFVRDISRYKEALRKVQESEERFRFLSQSTFEGIFIHKNGIVLDCNDSFLKMYGFLKEEIVGKDMIETVICESDRKKIAQNIVKKVAKPYIIGAQKKDGSSFIAEIEARNVEYDGEEVRIAAVRDVSERFQMQKEIEETKRKLETLMGNLPGMAYTCLNNPLWEMNYMSAGCKELLGYEPEELINNSVTSYSEIIHDDDREMVWDTIQAAIRKNERFELEYRIITKEGKQKWVWEKGKLVQTGEQEFLEGFINDITLRKKTEEILQQREEQYRTVFNTTGTAMCIVESDGTISLANEQFEILAGYPLNDIVGKMRWMEFVVNEDLDRMLGQHRLRRKDPDSALHSYEFRFIDKKQNIKHIQLTVDVIPGTDKSVTALSDITARVEAELLLKQNEERMRSITESAKDAIIQIDHNGRVIFWNPAAESIFGYSENEMLGENLHELIAPEEYHQIQKEKFAHFIKTGQGSAVGKTTELKGKRKNGEIFPVELSLSPTEINSQWGATGILRDITQRKKYEEQVLKLLEDQKIILDNDPSFIIYKDLDNNILRITNTVALMTGLPKEKIEGRHSSEVYPELADDYYSDDKKVIETGNPVRGIVEELKSVDGKSYWLLTDKIPVFEQEKVTGIIVFSTDITDLKNFQYELEEKNKQLQQEKRKAEESDHLKSAFLATMSHELRTPLNHIIGFSDILPDMTDDPQIIKFSNLIHKGGIDLLNMIEDIFDLAMIEKTEVKVRASEVKIRDIYADIKKELQDSLYESDKREHISLEFSIDPSITDVNIVTDKPKIIQVMTNLIKNAVKYTFRGKIGLEMLMDSDKNLSIGIRDTGIGVPDELHEKIFEFFRQGDDSHTRVHGGIGLGLAISQKIAHAMNGKILLESEVGKGSLFSFVFPVNILGEKNESSAAMISSGNGFSLEGKKILLAEDDFTSMELIKIVLEPHGGEIFCAENGKLALEYVEKGLKPDVILMDLKMPEMDGFTATREIRKILPRVPVIALTAYALVKDEAKAKDAGCDVVVTKPIRIDHFVDTLKKYIAD